MAKRVEPPAITFEEKPTTPQHLDKLLEAIKTELNRLKEARQSSSAIARVASEYDNYKAQTTTFMQTLPDIVITQGKETFTSYVKPHLAQALGGLGGLHWMAVGLSVVAWLLDTTTIYGQNRKACLNLLHRAVDLLEYTKDLWTATNNDGDTKLISILQRTVEITFNSVVVCTSTMQGDNLKRFLNAPNVKRIISNVEKDLDNARGQITAQLHSINYRKGPRIKAESSTNGVTGDHIVGGDEMIRDAFQFMDRVHGKLLLVSLKGMGGIGKTTLGEAISNQIKEKQNDDGTKRYRCCTVHLKVGIQEGKLHKVQEEIFEKLCKFKPPTRVSRLEEGVKQLQVELSKIKEPVFLYLDNVLEYNVNWLPRARAFPTGSIILVTTRYKEVCNNVANKLELDHHYCKVIEVIKLGEAQAKELLHRQFKMQPKDHTQQEIETLEKEVLQLCDGLPLALKVVGAFIQNSDGGPRDASVWRRVIYAMEAAESLYGGEKDELYSHLRFSIEQLRPAHKQAFLDIVTFAVGRPWAAASRLLEPYSMDILCEHSLVSKTVPNKTNLDGDNENGDEEFDDYVNFENDYEDVSRVTVHDVLLKMGRQMVQKDNEDGHEIRVIGAEGWHKYVGSSHTKQTNVVGLVDVKTTAQQLQQMHKLRFLSKVTIEGECPPQDAKSHDLRVVSQIRVDSSKSLNLKYCPLKELSIKVLGATNCSMKDLQWDEKSAHHLEILTFRNWHQLQHMDDMHCFPSLKRLTIDFCGKLTRLPEGAANNWGALRSLSLWWCGSLASLPEGAANWGALRSLGLVKCGSLASLPEGAANWGALRNLCLLACRSLASLPEGAANWGALEEMVLLGCTSLERLPQGLFARFRRLRTLNLIDCCGLRRALEGGGLFEQLPADSRLEVLCLDTCHLPASLFTDDNQWQQQQKLKSPEQYLLRLFQRRELVSFSRNLTYKLSSLKQLGVRCCGEYADKMKALPLQQLLQLPRLKRLGIVLPRDFLPRDFLASANSECNVSYHYDIPYECILM